MGQGRSDVLVIGAGPAGAVAALGLARRGLDVCVVDRARFPRDKTCGDAVSSKAMAIADEHGAGEEIRGRAHAVVRTARAVFPDGTVVARRYDDPGYIVPRFDLDDALRRALDRTGATVLEGVGVRTVVEDGGGVIGAEGPGLSWRARAVLAADGPGSVGWPAVGRAYPRGRDLAVAATVYCRGVAFPDGADVSDHYFDRALPYGYGWIFPAVDGVSNVGVYQRADAYHAAGLSLRVLLDGFVERHGDRLATAQPIAKVRTWALPIGGGRRRCGVPGLLLLGDAAGYVDPLSGEGIWQAMFTGTRAAAIVGDALAEGGQLDERAVQRYEGECARTLGRHGRTRAWIQSAMHGIVRHELYRLRAVRAALAWGYGGGRLERSKTVSAR